MSVITPASSSLRGVRRKQCLFLRLETDSIQLFRPFVWMRHKSTSTGNPTSDAPKSGSKDSTHRITQREDISRTASRWTIKKTIREVSEIHLTNGTLATLRTKRIESADNPKASLLPSISPRVDQNPIESTLKVSECTTQHHPTGSRRNLLFPTLWTLLALTGTYTSLAYLDIHLGDPFPDEATLPPRSSSHLPQTWYITPSLIHQGAFALWSDLDPLTITLVLAITTTHLLRRLPLASWRSTLSVTSKHKWTSLPHPFVHRSWVHAGRNVLALVWVLPSVVQYFECDVYHTSAFLLGSQFVARFATHVFRRFIPVGGVALAVGTSGMVAAALGVYCVEYTGEKMWVPQGMFLRIDAMWVGLGFVVWEVWKGVRGGNRVGCLVNLVSLGSGAAYAYFNLKHHLWIPLVATISGAQGNDIEVEE